MKLSKTEVLKFIDDASAALKKAHDESERAFVQQNAKDVAEWKRRFGAQWADASRVIARAVKRDEPITSVMLPRGDYRDLATFDPRRSAKAFVEPDDLKAARTYLKAVVGAVVTETPLIRAVYHRYGALNGKCR